MTGLPDSHEGVALRPAGLVPPSVALNRPFVLPSASPPAESTGTVAQFDMAGAVAGAPQVDAVASSAGALAPTLPAVGRGGCGGRAASPRLSDW
jgi:hypothetical protein